LDSDGHNTILRTSYYIRTTYFDLQSFASLPTLFVVAPYANFSDYMIC